MLVVSQADTNKSFSLSHVINISCSLAFPSRVTYTVWCIGWKLYDNIDQQKLCMSL